VPEPGPLSHGELAIEGGGPVVVGVSPMPTFRPLVTARLEAGTVSWSPPADFLSAIEGSRWFARVFDPETLGVLSEGTFGAVGP
jgi:hypothetical protein